MLRLAAEASRDPLTVQRVLDGKGNAQSVAAVISAAQRLNVVLPAKAIDRDTLKIRAT